jgi:hypothetical protein
VAKRKAVVDEPVESPETAEAVQDTAEVLADARQKLADAEAEHAAALTAHQEATRGPRPVKGQHIAFEHGGFVDLPEEHGGIEPFRVQIDGVSYDHVSETESWVDENGLRHSGVWVYRRM